MTSTVTWGSRSIGERHPCFIIAEAGSNHNGSLEQAVRLIKVAAEAKADAVKFQLFRASRMYPVGAGISDYLKLPTPIYEIIRQMEMPYAWLPELAREAGRRGVMLLVTPFDEESADRLDPFVEAFKIASYELTHLPLVRHVARKGKPVILSTGTASLEEVAETVEAIREEGNDRIILMQCTAAYPAPTASLNLRAMTTMQASFGVPVGLSDHSRDPLLAPLTAVAAGARALEKHFTLSRSLPGPDHGFAVEPEELRVMVQRIRETEQALGDGIKQPHPVEDELRRFARRSIYALRDIRPGERFSAENIRVLRCGKLPAGMPPKDFPSLLGRRAACRIRAEEPILQAHVRQEGAACSR